MLDFTGSVRALMPLVERIELGPIEPVGEPGDGSVAYMRVLRITTASCTFELTLMADDAAVLAVL